MKAMYLYLSLFAAIFAVGIVLGLILFKAADENKTAVENIETGYLHQHEVVQVLDDGIAKGLLNAKQDNRLLYIS